MSPDGKTLASCGNDQLVKLWAAADGSRCGTLDGPRRARLQRRLPPGRHAARLRRPEGHRQGLGPATGTCVRDLDAKVLHKYDSGFMADIGGARGMAFAPDGRLAVRHHERVERLRRRRQPAGRAVRLEGRQGEATQAEGRLPGDGVGRRRSTRPATHRGRRRRQRPRLVLEGRRHGELHTVNVPANARDLALHPDGTALAVAGANGSTYVYTLIPGPPAAKQEPAPPPKKK